MLVAGVAPDSRPLAICRPDNRSIFKSVGSVHFHAGTRIRVKGEMHFSSGKRCAYQYTLHFLTNAVGHLDKGGYEEGVIVGRDHKLL